MDRNRINRFKENEDIECCLSNDAITKEYHTDNLMYSACKDYMTYNADNLIAQLLIPENNVFALQKPFTISPKKIIVHKLDCYYDEACIAIIEKIYDTKVDDLDHKLAVNLYMLDTSLCVIYRKGKKSVFATRNPYILDRLQCAPMCRIYDINSYLLAPDLRGTKRVTAIFAQATEIGYQLSYDMIDLCDDDCVILPYVWLQHFLHDLTLAHRCGYVDLRFKYYGSTHIAKATACKFVTDHNLRKAVEYIHDHRTQEIGQIQFVCAKTGNIYCINVTDIISIS